MNAIDHKPFLDAIEAVVQDAAPKLVYADWLDEQELPIPATVWRWLGRTGRYPYFDRKGYEAWRFGNEADLEDVRDSGIGSQCCLPNSLHRGLEYAYGKTVPFLVGNLIRKWEYLTTPRGWFRKKTIFVPSWEPVLIITAQEADYRLRLRGIY